MSRFNYLQFQPIDDTTTGSIPDDQIADEEIDLHDQIDENTLDAYWDKVVADIHQDPDWYQFADE